MVNAMSAPGSGLLAIGRLPSRMTQCEFSAQALHTNVSPGLLIATILIGAQLRHRLKARATGGGDGRVGSQAECGSAQTGEWLARNVSKEVQ